MKFKNSYKSTLRWIFALLMYYIFAIPITSNAQSILNVGIGADLQEGYNVSIRYQAEQTQYALGIGTQKDEFEKIISVSASMCYHFDGISTLTMVPAIDSFISKRMASPIFVHTVAVM